MGLEPVNQLLSSLPIDKSTVSWLIARTQQRLDERAAGTPSSTPRLLPIPLHPTLIPPVFSTLPH